MIKQYIFDIGNVLVDFHPIPYFQKLLPDKQMDYVCSLVFAQEWEQMDEGLFTCAEVREIMLSKYPLFHEQIQCIFDHWMEMMTLCEECIDYIKELKEHGYGIYLLSNIGEESYQYLRHKYTFFDLADGMVLSYEVHCNKPNHRIYETLLTKYNLRSEECIFFDDRKQNIESAKQLGIHSILFENTKQARNEVKQYVSDK